MKMEAMNTDLVKEMKAHIEEINRLSVEHSALKAPENLYEPLTYTMAEGGKRMRPYLVYLGYLLYSNEINDDCRLVGQAVEFFHNFTLIHDDVMDDAPLRRGKPTVYKKYGLNAAILSGDIALLKVYEFLADVSTDYIKPLMKAFNQCAIEVCEGQQIDADFEERMDVEVGEYLEMIRLKTAVLLGYSLQAGAIVAGASTEEADKVRQMGTYLGIGFQLMDDYLDVYGDLSKFGKQEGGDIILNKKTYLLIQAMNRSEGSLAVELNDWISKTEFDAQEKVKAVKAIYQQLGVPEQTYQLMQTYYDKAFAILDELQSEASAKFKLKSYIELLIKREK